MDAVERDEAIRHLLEQQKQINMQIQKLGVGGGVKEQPRSPDGGAVSFAHYHLTPTSVPTMRVKLRKVPNSDEAIIARSAFDPEKHESLEVRARRVVGSAAAPKAAAAGSNLTRDELLTMTVPVLRTQPELRGVPDTEIPDKKADIVALIVSRRDTALANVE